MWYSLLGNNPGHLTSELQIHYLSLIYFIFSYLFNFIFVYSSLFSHMPWKRLPFDLCWVSVSLKPRRSEPAEGKPCLSVFTCRETSDTPAAAARWPGKSWWWFCPAWKTCASEASTSRRRSGSLWAGWGWKRPRTQEVGAEHTTSRCVPAPLTTLVTHAR